LGILLFLLTKEKYQNILLGKATKYLSEKLKTRVHIDHVKFSFFNHFDIHGVYVEDQQKDTLAYVGTLRLKTSELLSNY
jgi:translocation and assembly module TamB